jgi:glycosyltransferase involved in cell wall biosynthesis
MMRATAAVVPSQWLETFGLVVVEAMAAGVVPVAPNHASFPELVHHNVDGVLYPPGDSGALSAIFRSLDDHPGHFATMGVSAKKTYEENHGPAQNVAQLERIYRFAIESPAWLDRSRTAAELSGGEPETA